MAAVQTGPYPLIIARDTDGIGGVGVRSSAVDRDDPRDRVTNTAFQIDSALMGAVLATPTRRALALLIDLVCIGLLTAIVPGFVLLVLLAVALYLRSRSVVESGARRWTFRGAALAIFGFALFAVWANDRDETPTVRVAFELDDASKNAEATARAAARGEPPAPAGAAPRRRHRFASRPAAAPGSSSAPAPRTPSPGRLRR